MSRHIFNPTDDLARQRMLRQIAAAPLTDERGRGYVVIFQRVQQKTRIPEKGLFYVWAKAIADHTGNDARSTADDLKAMFLPVVEHINFFTGEVTYQRQSSEDLDVMGWRDLLTRVEAFANSDLGITLPRRESDAALAAYRHYSAAMAAGEV